MTKTIGPIDKAREFLKIEALAIEEAAHRLGATFEHAIEMIEETLEAKGKLVFCAVGKSSYVAKKLAASFLSTGVSAVFIHPAEAPHGDLGAILPGDLCIFISKSGTTQELQSLLFYLKNKNKIISITGDLNSPLAEHANCVLDARIDQEACPINMVPTASTTVALALGDALVSILADRRGFGREDFAVVHPGGAIGKKLNLKVSQVAIDPAMIAKGAETLSLQEVAVLMGKFPRGAFCVVDSKDQVSGLITDGDLRRAIAKGVDFKSLLAKDIMTKTFTYLSPEMMGAEALNKLEIKGRRLTCAPVLDKNKKLIGFVQIQDLL